MTFNDEVVLVTGASRGIGRAVARRFAREGARVAIHYHRDRDAAEETLSTLSGGPHAIFQADVAEAVETQALAEAVIEQMGAVHVLVNNAGIFEDHRIAEVDFGRIVNISSRGAFRGEPDSPAYGASKAGLNSMSQSLAVALAPHGIFVGVVAPGWVETDMSTEHLAGPDGDAIRQQSPMNRVAHPDEIARAVVFLASSGIDDLTGCIIDANGASYLRT